MSTPLIIQYPLDPTGINPNNAVVNEPHTLPSRTVRVFATAYGAFYTESLVVRDVATGLPLTKDVQYYAAELYELPSARYGKEICAIVVITDPTVSNNIVCDYQCLGGPFGTSAQAIIQQIENLNLDDRPVAWGNIINKPSEYEPSHHLHDVGDVYGFEYVVHALDRIRAAIEFGDAASHDAIYEYIDRIEADLLALINTGNGNLQAHLQDTNNPHGTTAAQVGAYTKAESNAITNPITTALNAHTANTNNPHATTAAQVGAYTQAQTDTAITTAVNAAKLGFTPVQQGGGNLQNNNKIYLGWDGTRLRLQVDSSDIGQIPTYTEYSNAVSSLQTQINGKQPTGPYAQTGVDMSVSFWDVTARGTIYSQNDVWAFNSDRRLKKNIRRIDSALEKVRKVRGVLYRYKVDAIKLLKMEDRDYMGFIAQEVQAVCPEIVGLAPFDRDDKTGKSKSGHNFLTIQYDKYCALLNEAVRELDDKVNAIALHVGFDV